MSARPRLRDSNVARDDVEIATLRARPARELLRQPVAPARPVVAESRGPKPVTAARVFFLVVVAALASGFYAQTEDYVTPQWGLGYALGIVGGSMMLLLLVYPLRKRMPALRYLGSTRFWFRFHMVLGVLGPVMILYHSNFGFGAVNSNVALVCMLIVAGSGLFGRYFYGRIHHELHGRRSTLTELKDFADRLRHVTTGVTFLPEVVERIAADEAIIEFRCERTPLLLRPLIGVSWAWTARRRLRKYVRAAVHALPAPQRDAQRKAAFRYVDDRLGATRRVVEFQAFEQFFSLWHALHMPLFVMLVVAGTVHVFAVHLY
jgi:hypothetical protein